MTAAAADVIDAALAMNAAGINVGASGNVSVRAGDGFLVTPSGVPYDQLVEDDIVEMDMSGEWRVGADRHPSSEWRFHRDILLARRDVEAVVHAHPVHATAMAVHEMAIPPFHYMVAIAGGDDIRCAPYATFGTQELSDAIVTALDGRLACLIGHHGLVACGRDLEHSLSVAVEVEHLAAQYIAARLLGEPPLLDEAEMDIVLAKMAAGAGYGSS